MLLAVSVTAVSVTAVSVTAVSVTAIGNDLLDQATTTHPTLTKTWVDAGFNVKTVEYGDIADADAVKDPQVKGFSVVKRRWAVERTLGRLMQHRRLACDYETQPANSEAMITIATIDEPDPPPHRRNHPNPA